MALTPGELLIALGSVLLVGWLGGLLFARTKIPDVLLLMAFGVLLGWLAARQDLDTRVLNTITPYVGALALITILFDGGLKLKIKDLLSGAPRATLLAFTGFVATMGAVALYVFLVLREKLGLRKPAPTVLSLESALTDVLCVVVAITLAQAIATGQASWGEAARDLMGSFALAIVIGVAVGIAWLKALAWLEGGLEYMMTLAVLFALYGVTEILQGSGAIAVLAFGMILGNGRRLAERLHMQVGSFTDTIPRFQEEITFFVRTFFFVYLGIILDVGLLTSGRFLLMVTGLVATLAFARLLAVRVSVRGSRPLEHESKTMFLMMPRGLAAAALAAMPAFQYGIVEAEFFIDFAFGVIVLTNVISTAAAVAVGRRKSTTEPDAVPA